MNAIISRIRSYPEKGRAGLELYEAQLIENLGLLGDRHAQGGERQISLLLAENLEQSPYREKALCLARFRENITILGMVPALAADTLPALVPGTLLGAGEAILEITGETKRCHEECALYKSGERCSLAGLNLFAKVLKGGIIRVGEQICKIEEISIIK